MSEIKIELAAEDINKAVADAIIRSVLGATIAKSVEEHVKSMITRGYDNPIDKVINDVIKNKIIELVNQQYKSQIEAAVQQKITGETGDRLVFLAVEKFLKAIY